MLPLRAVIEPCRTRAWPLPARPWSIRMIWHDLLFAHWPVEPSAVQEKLPAGLSIDMFDGCAWIGVVPFRMSIRRRGWPPLPGLSAFPELNLRTYVVADGKPGVWFFTLDTPNRIAVRIARRFFHLPYCDARIRCRQRADGWIEYRSDRRERRSPPARFAARYRPLAKQATANAAPVTDPLTNWLTARYCLYAASRHGQLFRGEINHAPWPLEHAEAVIDENTLAAAAGIELPGCAPLLHFSRRLETVAWTLDRV